MLNILCKVQYRAANNQVKCSICKGQIFCCANHEIFQGIIRDRYEEMVSEFGLTVIDATRSIEEQQNEVRAIVERALVDLPRKAVGPSRIE